METYREYLDFAKDLAYQAGKIIQAHFRTDMVVEIKDDDSPVTIADKAINQLVIETVQTTYPTHSILSEEGSALLGNTDFTWVCDPIDGTKPFTLGLPLSMFSLALVKDGVSIVAVLYDPYGDRMFSACIGEGAFVNNKPLRVNSTKELAGAYMSAPGNPFGVLDDVRPLHQALLSEKACLFCFGCITSESMLIAEGRFAASIFPGRDAWDVAAIKLIIEEAGGKVTDLHGNEQRYDRAINGALHVQLLELTALLPEEVRQRA